MSLALDFLLRIVWLLFAYGCAVLAGALALHVAALPVFRPLLEAEPALAGGAVVSVVFMTFVAARLAFLPALVLIGLSEGMRLRGLTLHIVGGAICGFAALALYWQADGRPMEEFSFTYTPEAIAAVVAAGMVGGFVHWLLAGRRAGYWLDRARSLADERREGR